jgi:hypothetical protein
MLGKWLFRKESPSKECTSPKDEGRCPAACSTSCFPAEKRMMAELALFPSCAIQEVFLEGARKVFTSWI